MARTAPPTGGELLASALSDEGVMYVFGVPAWQIDWAVDGLARRRDGPRFLSTRHEQAAAYMADGFARSTGSPGVMMVGPGPALLNASAGLSSAYACSSPVVCIAGQVPTWTIGRELGMHHEIPQQSRLLDEMTKWHALITDAAAVPAAVGAAFAAARAPRQRPVAIELPPDVLQARPDRIDRSAVVADTPPILQPDEAAMRKAAVLLSEAERPVIYAGWGVQAAGASVELAALAELLQAPVVMSDNGRGAISDRHPLALNALGGRIALPHADAILVVGSRFINGLGEPVAPTNERPVIHINADARDLGPPRTPTVAMHADAKRALSALVDLCGGGPAPSSRREEVRLVREWCAAQLAAMGPQVEWVSALRGAIPEDGILVSELTQVAYVAHLAYPVYQPRTFLTSGYAGILGYGFPTALGAAVGNPGRAVVSINGDGGFGFALQELATARLHELPVVAVVFNDGAYGNVRRTQRERFDGRELGSELANPDFVALAHAFGVQGVRVKTPGALRSALADAISDHLPALIEVPVGEMPSPWHLLHEHVPPPHAAPADPLLAEANA
jgi:acetolactate synthase-1/2/3 large subunit